jgi:hypothetical protein
VSELDLGEIPNNEESRASTTDIFVFWKFTQSPSSVTWCFMTLDRSMSNDLLWSSLFHRPPTPIYKALSELLSHPTTVHFAHQWAGQTSCASRQRKASHQ